MLVIDFGSTANQRLLPALQSELRATTDLYLRTAKVIDKVEFHGENFPTSLVLTLVSGNCAIPAAAKAWRGAPLGWVEEVDGELLSIIHLDCTRIGEALARADVQRGGEDTALAQGLTSVLRHELIHLARHSAEHDERGDFQATLAPKQLLAHPTRHLKSARKLQPLECE